MSELLTPEQTAEILHTTSKVLATYRCTKAVKIPYIKLGGKVLYRKSDLEAFINSCVVK